MHVGIIGGGIAGLVAAYELSKAAVKVTLFEREEKLGGLASSFAIDGSHDIERYYHFVCKPDHTYFEMMKKLGIYDRLRWVTTEMGCFYQDRLCTMSDLFSLLMFPHLSLTEKIRFGWSTLQCKLRNRSNWNDLENISAQEWLLSLYGQHTYDILYKPLLDLKFRTYARKISAAWMWARINRVGNSRTITQKERLGYLEGGTQIYISTLESAVRQMGGDIFLEATVEEIMVEKGLATGVYCEGKFHAFDQILSTIPIPLFRRLINNVDGSYFENLHSLEYIDVLVMVLHLSQRFSRHFWMNINDPQIDLAGIIEYTNLNPSPQLGGDAILYVPQYLTNDHPFYQMPGEQLFDLYCSYFSLIRTDFNKDWVKGYWIFRNRYAQPICEIGFSKHIPDIQTQIPNLYLTDSYQVHPDDRSISNSSGLGIKAARLILNRKRV